MSQNPTTPPGYSSTEDTPSDNLLARLRKITGVTAPAPVPGNAQLRVEDGAPPVDRLIPVVRDCFAAFAAGGIAAGVAAATGAVWLWGRSREGVRRGLEWQREMSARAAKARAERNQELERSLSLPIPVVPELPQPCEPLTDNTAILEESQAVRDSSAAQKVEALMESAPPAIAAVPEHSEIPRGRILKFFPRESGDAPEILTPVQEALPVDRPVEGTGSLIPGNVIALVPSIHVGPVNDLNDPVIALPAPAILRAKPARRFRRVLVATVAVLLLLPALWLVKPVRYYFTSLMGWGNAAVIVARDGWLFPRAETAIPATAAPPLRETAAALRAHGATLVVISVPAKSAVYPERLTGSGGGELERHSHVSAVLQELRDAGARVLDLGPVLHGLKTSDTAEEFVFSPQSAYWSPRGMAQGAFAAANFIQQQPGYAALPLQPSLAVMTPAMGLATPGDLVTALDSPRHQSRYAAQTVPLIRLLTAEKKEPLASDPSSPVALLGGQCVRVYDDPLPGHPVGVLPEALGSSAGFAQHLAWYLSMSLDVHTTGSSLDAAKNWLVARPEADRKAKRLIVWVLSDFDLLR